MYLFASPLLESLGKESGLVAVINTPVSLWYIVPLLVWNAESSLSNSTTPVSELNLANLSGV